MKNTPDQNKCFVAYYKINVPKYSCNLMMYTIPTITCDAPCYIKGKSFSYVINIVMFGFNRYLILQNYTIINIAR